MWTLMVHQQIVRDYMNIYSPYRGLLLYHGLGAGKTCASIGIAEGLKENSSLISLGLNWNKIGDDGAKAIADALKDNQLHFEYYSRWY